MSMAIYPLRLHVSYLALLIGGSLAAAAPAPAPEAPWDHPFNSDTNAVVQAAAAVPVEPGQPAVILFSDLTYRYDEQGRETRTERLVYRIVTPGAHDSWSVVSKQWSPWHQQKPEIRARVISPDGKEHWLDPAVMVENGTGGNQPDLFEDARILRAPLPATGAGAVVEEEIAVRETTPFFEGGVVRYAPFAQAVASRRARLTVDAPEALPLSWVTRLLPATPANDVRAAGRRRLTFEYRDLPKIEEPEPGLPPDVPRLPYVAFSTGASWAEIAKRYSAIVDQAIRGSDVSQLTAAADGVPSQEEAVARVLAKLAEIRYTAVELGQGGIVPRTPDETLRRRFGDCKDKSVLLVAALRALDIPAYVALLSAGEGEADIEPTLPGLGSFDHAIAVVPGSPPIWIDPTDPYARAGELPLADQGRYALIASPTATGLSRTPEASAAENREVETREFHLAELGAARVRETAEYHGAPERTLRAYYAAIDRDQVKKELTTYAIDAYLARELTRFDFSSPNRLAEPFRIEIELAGVRRGMTDMTEAAVGIHLAGLLSRLPEELRPVEGDEEEEPRRNDYYFARPLSAELRYRIVPPKGFVSRPMPASVSRALGTVTLSEEYSVAADGSVSATFKLDSGKRRLTPQELATLREKLAELEETKTNALFFEHTGEAHLAAGRIREALVEMQHQSREAPGKALPRTRVARALLAGGLGEAAREEARAAIAAEPSSAIAHRTLAWILQHDELGRRFGKGFDRAGALAAYRKAKTLDPNDFGTRGGLAILLEHDADGRRYAAGADLAAAISEYQSLRTDLKETGLDDNLLVALARAGRFVEVKKLTQELDASPLRSALRLAALAATAGAEEALREADRTFSSAEKPGALATASQSLLQTRRYPEAAAFYQKLGQISSAASELLPLADVLRHVTPHENLTLDPASPATPLRRMLLLAVTAGDQDLNQIFAVHGSEAFKPEDLQEMREVMTGSFAESQAGDLPVDAAIDITFAVMRETVTGNDMTGYRIELKAEIGEAQMAAYVIRAEGGYRIAGLSEVPDTLATQALHFLRHGDLAAARQWLDWTRDEIATPAYTLAERAFVKLWNKGRRAETEEARCAAALLAADEPDDERIRLLTTCRDAAVAAKDTSRQATFEEALTGLYESLSRYPEMLESARRLAALRPGNDEDDPDWMVAALRGLGRWDELRALAERRLADEPDDTDMRALLSDVAFATGDLPRGYEILAPLADANDANSIVLNRAAWASLFRSQTDERALGWSRRAVTLSRRSSYASLHTLAALQAEQGQTAEAYKSILEALEVRDDSSPTPDDWYVFGRLAEQYGLPEVARGLYRRALPKITVEVDLLSTRKLAETRLAALGPEPPARRAESRKPKP